MAQNFVGVVKSFNPTKGWGFIECDQSKQIYGSDVFLLKGALQGFGVSQGDQVSFIVTQGPKGIQASNVKVLADPAQQTFLGEVKSYNPQKGFGFIASTASEQVYGKDIFVLKSDLNNPMAGQGTQVQFKVKQGDRGPVACEVQVLNAGGGPGMGMGMGMGGPPQQQQWGGFGAWGAPPQQQQQWGPPQQWGGWSTGGPVVGGYGAMPGAGAMGGKIVSETENFYGELKNVNAEKGWGHISCEAMNKIYGKDLFVMRSNLEGVSIDQGQGVVFSVAQGPKGPHATNLRPFNPPPAETVFSGAVKSFNDTKGWGFIESSMSKDVYFTDIFVHKKDLDGNTLTAGDQVQYCVSIQGGRAVAKNVIGGSPAPGGGCGGCGGGYGGGMIMPMGGKGGTIRASPY